MVITYSATNHYDKSQQQQQQKPLITTQIIMTMCEVYGLYGHLWLNGTAEKASTHDLDTKKAPPTSSAWFTCEHFNMVFQTKEYLKDGHTQERR